MYITFAELKNSFNFNVASFSSAVTLRYIDFTSQNEKLTIKSHFLSCLNNVLKQKYYFTSYYLK